jgi:glutamyl-tRNA reductase
LQLVLVGLNHHSAPIAVRERLNCAEHALPEALAAAVACAGVREAVVLSTCNRMEVYAVVEADGAQTAHDTLCRYLSAYHNVPESAFLSHLFRLAGPEAASHLMRVAAGLDSLVLGEAQILGQVRAAFQAAQEAGTCGPILAALFQQALASGKRVRHETALGRGAFSIGRAAVDLAHSIFSDLSHAGVLILGAGKMSELTAKHLVSNGVRFVVVANRTYEKAVSMAAKLGGQAIQYDSFMEALATADIVISSTAAPHPIIRRETLAPVLRKRRGKPLFLIDIAVPRDVDTDVNGLDNVFLYNIDDLEAVVAEEARGRVQEAEKAGAIASEEAAKFLAWFRTREAAPVITLLQERLARIREEELALLRSQLGSLSEREWKHIEAATRAMMNKVAREPILRLKRETSQAIEETASIQYDLMTAAREIFGLAQAAEPASSAQDTAAEDEAAAAPSQPTAAIEIQSGAPCKTVESRP